MVKQFRQGSTERLETVFINHSGFLVSQPEGLPTVEIHYIDTLGDFELHTAVPPTIMNTIEPGRYFFDWEIPFDQPQVVHQITYRGAIDELSVIGEDIATVLPAISVIGGTVKCTFEPMVIQGKSCC